MKAHLIDAHLLVLRSRSSAKVKVKYQGHVSQKMGVPGTLMFHKHILFRIGLRRIKDCVQMEKYLTHERLKFSTALVDDMFSGKIQNSKMNDSKFFYDQQSLKALRPVYSFTFSLTNC